MVRLLMLFYISIRYIAIILACLFGPTWPVHLTHSMICVLSEMIKEMCG